MDDKIKPTADKNQLIVNTVAPDGNVLCPVCKRGAIWTGENGKMYTSPMRRFRIPGKVDALMHECCIYKILSEARIKK